MFDKKGKAEEKAMFMIKIAGIVALWAVSAITVYYCAGVGVVLSLFSILGTIEIICA